MLHTYLIPDNASPGRSESFVLGLPEYPYSGLVGKADYPPMFLLMCLSGLIFWPLVLFIFTRLLIQHLGILEKILRAVMCSWGFTLNVGVSKLFGGGSKFVGKLDVAFRANLLKVFILIFSYISALFAWFLLSIRPLLSGSALVGIIIGPLFPSEGTFVFFRGTD